MMLFNLVDRVPYFHRCPRLKLGRSIVGIWREWGAEFGPEKLTGKGQEGMLQVG